MITPSLSSSSAQHQESSFTVRKTMLAGEVSAACNIYTPLATVARSVADMGPVCLCYLGSGQEARQVETRISKELEISLIEAVYKVQNQLALLCHSRSSSDERVVFLACSVDVSALDVVDNASYNSCCNHC